MLIKQKCRKQSLEEKELDILETAVKRQNEKQA